MSVSRNTCLFYLQTKSAWDSDEQITVLSECEQNVSKLLTPAGLVDEAGENPPWLKTQGKVPVFLLISPCNSDGLKNKPLVMYLGICLSL